MKYIAVLLTVFNRKQKTLLCLERLFNQTLPENYQLQVFLTDDGSTDGTSEAIDERFSSRVNIIKGDGSLFWNRGMHRAWTVASSEREFDYYLWLNDDTFLYDGAIFKLLIESSHYNDRAILVGSTCATNDKDKITYGGWWKGKLHVDLSKPNKCDAINGNIVLVPSYAFSVLGFNDPYYRHAAGDTDYGLSALKAGIETWTVVGCLGECDLHERPTVWMDPSQPFKKRWRNFFSPLGNNPFEFFYFKRKHFGLLSACFTFCTMWLHFFLPRLWRNS